MLRISYDLSFICKIFQDTCLTSALPSPAATISLSSSAKATLETSVVSSNMQALLCFSSLNLFVKETPVRTVLTLRSRCLFDMANEGRGHAGHRFRECPQIALFGAKKDCILPVFAFRRNFRVHSDSYDELYRWMEDENRYEHRSFLYETLRLALGRLAFQTEVLSILNAGRESLATGVKGGCIVICSDTQVELKGVRICYIILFSYNFL